MTFLILTNIPLISLNRLLFFRGCFQIYENTIFYSFFGYIHYSVRFYTFLLLRKRSAFEGGTRGFFSYSVFDGLRDFFQVYCFKSVFNGNSIILICIVLSAITDIPIPKRKASDKNIFFIMVKLKCLFDI